MNPLQEHPNLFANGKFRVGHLNGNIYQFRGYDNGHPDDPNVRLGDGSWSFLRNCTLIARPIADMTEEEIRDIAPTICESTSVEYVRELLIKGRMKADIELLAIGIYPFDQEAFEDGTVIKSEASND